MNASAPQLEQLPLFPLGSVLMPEGLLPLRIFEPRYLDMVSTCLRNGHGFGVCLIRRGSESGDATIPYGTGTEAHIVDWDRQPDGLLGVTARGARKFRIHELSEQEDGLLIGQVEWLPPEPHACVPEDCQLLVELLRGMLRQLESIIQYPAPDYDDARWVGGRLTELLPLSPRVRQYLLELDNPTARLLELRQAVR